MSEQVPPTRLREGAAAEAALVDTIFNRLQTAQEALLAGRSSVTAQAFIIAVWTEAHPLASAIAVARFLNGGSDEMRDPAELLARIEPKCMICGTALEFHGQLCPRCVPPGRRST